MRTVSAQEKFSRWSWRCGGVIAGDDERSCVMMNDDME